MFACSEVDDRVGTVSQVLPSVFVYVVETVAAERDTSKQNCMLIASWSVYVDNFEHVTDETDRGQRVAQHVGLVGCFPRHTLGSRSFL